MRMPLGERNSTKSQRKRVTQSTARVEGLLCEGDERRLSSLLRCNNRPDVGARPTILLTSQGFFDCAAAADQPSSPTTPGTCPLHARDLLHARPVA